LLIPNAFRLKREQFCSALSLPIILGLMVNQSYLKLQ
jgi:hypothetical protein